MAPTTKHVEPKPKVTSKSKSKERDRVVKRPARGFHRFRNGMLNVTPKGGEKELVKRNQNSPLLRLPAELRTQIWQYVLGYKLINMWFSFTLHTAWGRVAAPITERTNLADLLCTCRQIYTEAAYLPYSTNIFSFDAYEAIYDQFKTFKQYQRATITHIQLNFFDFYSFWLQPRVPLEKLANRKRLNLSFLPALKQIRVVLLAARKDPAEETRRLVVETQLKALLADDRNVEIVFEQHTQKKWNEYVVKWSYPKN